MKQFRHLFKHIFVKYVYKNIYIWFMKQSVFIPSMDFTVSSSPFIPFACIMIMKTHTAGICMDLG